MSCDDTESSASATFDVVTGALLCLLGVGSWITINGVFQQLPILANELPEGWALPTWITVMIQSANVAPLVLLCLQKHWSVDLTKQGICAGIILNIAAMAALGTGLYRETTDIEGRSHSLMFFLLLTIAASADCLSSVTYWHYVGSFSHEAYVTAVAIGEGLSAVMPSVLAWAQDPGANHPRFSAGVYFVLLSCIMSVVLAAFLALNARKKEENVHALRAPTISVAEGVCENRVEKDEEGDSLLNATEHAAWLLAGKADEHRYHAIGETPVNGDAERPLDGPQYSKGAHGVVADSVHRDSETSWDDEMQLHGDRIVDLCLFLLFFTSFLQNGALLSCQSYASQSYSNETYHWSLVGSMIVQPIGSGLVFFVPVPLGGAAALLLILFLSFACAGYQFYIATTSPHPPFNNGAGEFLTVSTSMVAAFAIQYLKTSAMTILRRHTGARSLASSTRSIRSPPNLHSGAALLQRAGIAIQVGSFVGSALFFVLVVVLRIFKQDSSGSGSW